jgi:ribonucleoside-diphosphate reductase alpha chain
MSYITERFILLPKTQKILKSMIPKFGFDKLGEVMYYRSYSRIKPDGNQEQWADTVIRVINGVISIRKDWYAKMHVPWHEDKWQTFAKNMAVSMFNMNFLPSGRNLWGMGTQYVFDRGSCSLYNCAAINSTNLSESSYWTMDMLFNGVGVGIKNDWNGILKIPNKNNKELFVIPDTREGWAKSIKILINAYTNGKFPYFDYSKIRKKGEIIKSFGGKASGADPLIKTHKQIENILDSFNYGKISKTQLVSDIFNIIGTCVVSLGVRRGAEILLGKPDDHIFINLKNKKIFPERENWSWMSNNSVILEKREDFEKHLPNIIDNILENGEPGILNLLNIQKYGRYGDIRHDDATLCNPCGEIPLEPYEVCNLSEIFPTRCSTYKEIHDATVFATFYCGTVSLLPTHHPKTNKVIAKNRRIGVSISGIAEIRDKIGSTGLIRMCRELYKVIRKTNKKFARDAGVPESIRVTTIKPSGKLSLIAGVTSGMHYPPYKYAINRIRIPNDHNITEILKLANITHEKDLYLDNSTVFEFPIKYDCNSGSTISVYEQFALLATLQREYSDNMISCTIYFDKKENNIIKNLLPEFIPVIKSVSLLQRNQNIYKQMPLEEISEEIYKNKIMNNSKINWNLLKSDGIDDKFCTGDKCSL